MYRILILSFVFVAALAADNTKCGRAFRPKHGNARDHVGGAHAWYYGRPMGMHCCKKGLEMMDKMMMNMSDLAECFELNRNPLSCERDLCIAKKKGFATADGKLDRAKLEELMTKDLESKPELLETLKKKCFNGDIEMYAPPEFCDFIKMKHCNGVHTLASCTEWNDNSECKDIKESIEECVQ